MLHSILITNGSKQDRLKKAKSIVNQQLKQSLDITILEPDPSITIKQVRQLVSFLSKKPVKLKNKIALIKDADKLTLPAQHAILKTLEEPPSHSIIILLSPQKSSLISTITSRCQVIKLKSTFKLTTQETKNQKKIYDQIIKANFGKRITIINSFTNTKQNALKFVKNQLLLLRSNPKKNIKSIKACQVCIKHLKANLNPKLALETLVFSYPSNIN